jgi:rubrerythrin
VNLIECTIKMKEETRAHYLRLAEAVDDKELKRIFSLLASAEEEHVHALTKMKDNMHTKVSAGAALSDSVCVFRPFLNSGNLTKELKNDSDAYSHVVAEEEETIDFYEQLAKQSKDDTLKKLCHRLASQERKHLNKIENIYSFVEDPRTYLEWGEFSNMKTL